MNHYPKCILYSRDVDLQQRIKGFLSQMAEVETVEEQADLQHVLGRVQSTILLIDLRSRTVRDILSYVVKHYPEVVIVIFGVPGSEPMTECEMLGLFAVEDLYIGRQRLQSLIMRASEQLRLIQENKFLKKTSSVVPQVPPVEMPVMQPVTPIERAIPQAQFQVQHLTGAMQHLDNGEVMLARLVEGIAGTAMVSRVGIFCRAREGRPFTLRAGLRCLDDARRLNFEDNSPFVQWLMLNAHMVSRSNLDHIQDTATRMMLQETLGRLGAELIVPLQGRERVLGWLFVGHRSTGLPFDQANLQQLMVIADHVGTTLENSLLYEEVNVQKTLAESLLHSIPTGIIAVDQSGHIQWSNKPAHQMFNVEPTRIQGRRVEVLDSRLADLLRRALIGDVVEQPNEWVEPYTKKTLSVQTQQLINGGQCLGAMALIEDVTIERMLAEKEEHVERKAFWTELAASMSHEIRNPAVAIKAFAQLLPERYEDEDFRKHFSSIVSDEIDRLNSIIDQISNFASPRKLEMRPVKVRHIIEKALENVSMQHNVKKVKLHDAISKNLPDIQGDELALMECVEHLLINSLEALELHQEPDITVSAKEPAKGEFSGGVEITVEDNGHGIPMDIYERIFSPFCTTKASSLGLGLPIVKRTIMDHNGHVNIESTPEGTCITLLLPANVQQVQEESYETHTHH